PHTPRPPSDRAMAEVASRPPARCNASPPPAAPGRPPMGLRSPRASIAAAPRQPVDPPPTHSRPATTVRSASMWKSSWARTVQQPADGGADTPSLRTPRPHQTGPPARLRLLLTIDSPLSTRLFQKLCGAKSTERPLRMGPRDCRYLGSG